MTKAELKYLQHLQKSKNRQVEKKYIVEGDKCALEWINENSCIEKVICTKEWADKYQVLLASVQHKVLLCEQHEIDKISSLSTPTSVLVLAHFLPFEHIDISKLEKEWILVLDSVRDPGNMGTIIRIADWFGVKHILMSHDCVDVYNPKVVQSSMGSLMRCNYHIVNDLAQLLSRSRMPKYVTHLQGKVLDRTKAYEPGFIIMGNESKGVSMELANIASDLVYIPKKGAAESLNVAVATGIVCSALIS